MTTRRGSKNSIQSDGGGLRSRNDPKKGKRKDKIPSGKEFTQGSAISQKPVPEMPIISEPESQLSMSHPSRNQSHSEGSDRHIHEPVKAILHSLQRQRLGDVTTNQPRIDELLENPQSIPQGGGNSEMLQWMESTVSQAPNQKDK
ncbi:hypothetical protein O181_034285 [Austropuccinia psidii MF-1]|uniref:Uncharacterized protein n=1 Tax=Austropuccinia psidii MF-1 TaxID=1389203 RepID=A0A9Q3D4L8_9BASI|nr:hypothetical protein [Austropuccinia psidii MF-1]